MFTIQQQVSLKQHNTLALSSKAEYFCRETSDEMLLEAMAWARDHHQAITLLGGGSNVVLTSDLAGLVIHVAIPGIELLSEDHHQRVVRVGAGENWHQLVLYTLNQGC